MLISTLAYFAKKLTWGIEILSSCKFPNDDELVSTFISYTGFLRKAYQHGSVIGHVVAKFGTDIADNNSW